MQVYQSGNKTNAPYVWWLIKNVICPHNKEKKSPKLVFHLVTQFGTAVTSGLKIFCLLCSQQRQSKFWMGNTQLCCCWESKHCTWLVPTLNICSKLLHRICLLRSSPHSVWVSQLVRVQQNALENWAGKESLGLVCSGKFSLLLALPWSWRFWIPQLQCAGAAALSSLMRVLQG